MYPHREIYTAAETVERWKDFYVPLNSRSSSGFPRISFCYKDTRAKERTPNHVQFNIKTDCEAGDIKSKEDSNIAEKPLRNIWDWLSGIRVMTLVMTFLWWWWWLLEIDNAGLAEIVARSAIYLPVPGDCNFINSFLMMRMNCCCCVPGPAFKITIGDVYNIDRMILSPNRLARWCNQP